MGAADWGQITRIMEERGVDLPDSVVISGEGPAGFQIEPGPIATADRSH
jgi:hypothetical protein